MEERRRLSRRHFLIGCGSFLGSLLVAACAKLQVIEKEVTRVVEKVVKETVVVEKPVKETVVVEKPVERTVVVEKKVMVTPEPTPSAYHESPMLAERVKAGELPPLEKRLPATPVVLAPRGDLGETLGKYGGMLTVMGLNPGEDAFGAEWGSGGALVEEWVATWDLADRRFVPNICDFWELPDDYKTLTLRIRKGVRWSDGEPLTTEDVRFWWEDIMLNENLTPALQIYFAPTGESMKVIIDDELTFRFVYPEPYVAARDRLSALAPWDAKHYLKKWHIRYNPEANDLAKEEGYEEWWEAFLAHQDARDYPGEAPLLGPYVPGELEDTGNRLSERNPYYWKVDSEGNQLPYVDYYEVVLMGSREIMEAKSVAGDYNFGGAWADLANYSLLKENEEKAGYTVRLYPGMNWGGSVCWCFNYTSKDPVVREIFNDLRFRKAMSYAINREDFDEVFNLGLSEIRQAIPPPDWTFHDPAMAKNYIDYDPDLANQLLDEMGLKWDDNHEHRLHPDGKPLILVTELGEEGHRPGEFEFVTEYWAKVGVEVKFKQVDQALYAQHLLANELDIGTWGAGGPPESVSHADFPIRLAPPWHHRVCCALAGIPWYDWWESKGERGEEPPQIIKDLYDVVDEWQAEPMGTERYLELGREIVRINAENLWYYVVVGPAPGISHAICATAVANEVQNLRDPKANAGWWYPELLWIEE